MTQRSSNDNKVKIFLTETPGRAATLLTISWDKLFSVALTAQLNAFREMAAIREAHSTSARPSPTSNFFSFSSVKISRSHYLSHEINSMSEIPLPPIPAHL